MMNSEASLDTRLVFAPRYHRHHVLGHQGHLGALGTVVSQPLSTPHEEEHQVRMGMVAHPSKNRGMQNTQAWEITSIPPDEIESRVCGG